MRPDEVSIGFEPVRPEHYPALKTWLAAPHMREWWGDPEVEFGYIRDMVEGRDTTRPYVITLEDRPIGYIQCWFIGHHQNEEWVKDNPWLTEFSADTVGVDLSIGEPGLLSKGIGSAALRLFSDRLADEGFTTIIIDPDPANGRAVRAYAKAGFRPVPHLEGRTGDVLLMQYEPVKADTRP